MLQQNTTEIQQPQSEEAQAAPALPFKALPPADRKDDYIVAIDDLEFEELSLGRNAGSITLAEKLIMDQMGSGTDPEPDELGSLIRIAAMISERWPELVGMGVDSLTLRRQMRRRH